MRLFPSHPARALAVGIATIGLVGIAGSPPASAATSKAAAVAPSCVVSWYSTGSVTKTFTVRNDCSYTVRVRMILARHTDSDCVSLGRGGSYSLTTARTAALSRVDSC